jgi:hypothetical protein
VDGFGGVGGGTSGDFSGLYPNKLEIPLKKNPPFCFLVFAMIIYCIDILSLQN